MKREMNCFLECESGLCSKERSQKCLIASQFLTFVSRIAPLYVRDRQTKLTPSYLLDNNLWWAAKFFSAQLKARLCPEQI